MQLELQDKGKGKIMNEIEIIYKEGKEFKNNIRHYIHKPGVWALFGEKGGIYVCLNVGKEPKHIYRIRNIMDFLFNYENIEKIYEKELELSEIGRQLSKLNADFSIYMSYRDKVRKIFKKLDLKYVDDIIEDKKTYME